MNIKDFKVTDIVNRKDIWLDTSEGTIQVRDMINASEFEPSIYCSYLGTYSGKIYDIIKTVYWDATDGHFDLEVNSIVTEIIEELFPEVVL